MTFAKHTINVFFLLCILFFNAPHIFAQESAGTTESKSFLWEVKSSNSTAYLFGSIHFANSSFYPLNQSIENAFKESSALVVELNPLTVDETAMQQIVMQKGLYPGNETIMDNISAESYGMLEGYLAQQDIPVQSFLKMRPGMIAIALSTIQLMKMGYSPVEGIDVYFATKAMNEKSIIELETMEEQLSLMFDMPEESLLLKYTLLDLENTDKIFNDIVTTWKAGDPVAMDNLILKRYDSNPELRPIMKKMFADRNIKMAAKIKDLLNTGEKYFVVVGAGHLVGEKGILQILKNENFTIRQL